MADLSEKIKLIIVDISGVDEAQLTSASDFEADLNIHRLELVEILDKLEEDFGITFSKEEGSDIKTLGELIRLVTEKVEE